MIPMLINDNDVNQFSRKKCCDSYAEIQTNSHASGYLMCASDQTQKKKRQI